ncbi:MAG: hypothetical protein V4549_07550 [Bacteroidota bacterium]
MEATPEKITEFIKAVKVMRQNQKAYFKSRDFSDLDRSKKSEREVDLMLVQFDAAPTLFNM